jgi:hypothetical protein
MQEHLDEIRKAATMLELHLMESEVSAETIATYIARIESATTKLYALNVVG